VRHPFLKDLINRQHNLKQMTHRKSEFQPGPTLDLYKESGLKDFNKQVFELNSGVSEPLATLKKGVCI
jgi:hypothetical protein